MDITKNIYVHLKLKPSLAYRQVIQKWMTVPMGPVCQSSICTALVWVLSFIKTVIWYIEVFSKPSLPIPFVIWVKLRISIKLFVWNYLPIYPNLRIIGQGISPKDDDNLQLFRLRWWYENIVAPGQRFLKPQYYGREYEVGNCPLQKLTFKRLLCWQKCKGS